MLLHEILIAIGIAVVLVVAAIDRLAARVMMGPGEMALLRLARAAAAQRRLVAAAAQQEPSRSGKREPQQLSAASWRTGETHSRHRSQRVSLRSSLNSKHRK
jgi:hypothetical protein